MPWCTWAGTCFWSSWRCASPQVRALRGIYRVAGRVTNDDRRRVFWMICVCASSRVLAVVGLRGRDR